MTLFKKLLKYNDFQKYNEIRKHKTYRKFLSNMTLIPLCFNLIQKAIGRHMDTIERPWDKNNIKHENRKRKRSYGAEKMITSIFIHVQADKKESFDLKNALICELNGYY